MTPKLSGIRYRIRSMDNGNARVDQWSRLSLSLAVRAILAAVLPIAFVITSLPQTTSCQQIYPARRCRIGEGGNHGTLYPGPERSK